VVHGFTRRNEEVRMWYRVNDDLSGARCYTKQEACLGMTFWTPILILFLNETVSIKQKKKAGLGIGDAE
jgi:hypothetical protein